MNKNQSNQFRMFLTTQDYLNNHSQVWSAISRVTQYKNDYDELLARIAQKAEEAGQGIGISDRKVKLKGALSVKASGLSGMLQAFAHEQDDTDLAEAVATSKSNLVKMRDQDIGAMVKKLTGTAEEHMADLADFGLTTDSLTEILSTLEEFNSLIGKPRNILSQRYVALGTLEELFTETSSLLRDKMDNILLMFRENNPEFYDGYTRARTIVDA
jgi:hypothetical protein